jgi:two-component system cell cycle response regulator
MSQENRRVVATFGIPDFERQILDRIFRLSSAREQTYGLADKGEAQLADIALVDLSTQKALTEWRSALAKHRDMKTVKVLPEEQGESTPSLSRPFLAKRVLTVLDGLFARSVKRAAGTPSEGPAPVANAVSQQGSMTNAAFYRALVVDDSHMIRTQVGLALQDAGIEVAYAECGEKALEIVNDEAFDIIFLDVLMTGLDGYEVCKAIKRDKARRHIPVVMLTSQSSPFDKIKGKFSGCDAYLTKPVRREEFQKTVDKYLIQALTSD